MITLADYKASTGMPADPDPSDGKIEFAIASASSLIRSYTGLQFDITGPFPMSTTRSYEYDGSGYLDIDECQAITGVTMESGYTGQTSTSIVLTSNDWSAYPLNGPVKTWLRLAEGAGFSISPAMGFNYNLDTLYDRYSIKPNIVKITGSWGWPEIPDDVKQAVIWTVASLTETERPYTQESIENYSRTRGGADSEEPIPLRAQAVLMNYIIPRL
jgi:hypothetical protein